MLNPAETDLLQGNWIDKTKTPINFKITIGCYYEGQKKISSLGYCIVAIF